MLAIGGCVRTESLYVWGAHASHDRTLYLVKHSSLLRKVIFPAPERSPSKEISESYEVVALDLRGREPLRPLGVKSHPKEHRPVGYDDYVAVADDGSVEIWGRAQIEARLRRVIGKACEGIVQYDMQDSRVLYYYCEAQHLAYRFEPPYDRASPLQLGPAGGMRQLSVYDCTFLSEVGDPNVYVRVGVDLLYEVDVTGQRSAVEIDMQAPDAISRGGKSSRDELIAITSNLRIYEIEDRQSQRRVVILRQGQVEREHELPAEVASQEHRSQYLAKGQLLLWILTGPGSDAVVVHSLDLKSGEFMRAAFSQPS